MMFGRFHGMFWMAVIGVLLPMVKNELHIVRGNGPEDESGASAPGAERLDNGFGSLRPVQTYHAIKRASEAHEDARCLGVKLEIRSWRTTADTKRRFAHVVSSANSCRRPRRRSVRFPPCGSRAVVGGCQSASTPTGRHRRSPEGSAASCGRRRQTPRRRQCSRGRSPSRVWAACASGSRRHQAWAWTRGRRKSARGEQRRGVGWPRDVEVESAHCGGAAGHGDGCGAAQREPKGLMSGPRRALAWSAPATMSLQ